MLFTQPRLRPGKGAGVRLLSCALVLAVFLLPSQGIAARNRTPRVHRSSPAPEPQFTHTIQSRMQGSHTGGQRALRSASPGRGTRQAAAGTTRGRAFRNVSNRSSAQSSFGTGSSRGSRSSRLMARTSLPVGSGRAQRVGRNHKLLSRDADNNTREPSAPVSHAVRRNRVAATGPVMDAQLGAPPAAVQPAARWLSAAVTAPDGIYARGQSMPSDDERLPPSRPRAAAPTVAMASSNDPLAAPIERPAPLRSLPESEADGATLGPAGDSPAAEEGASSIPPGEIGPALARPSREELAEAAGQPVVLPGLYHDGRLVMPAPLKGSHDVLVHQNQMADEAGLERIQNDAELHRLRANRQLIDFPESSSLSINPQLPYDRRCAREWTVNFVVDISHAFYARFHQPLNLSSAVRTVQFQLRLQRVNGNAAQIAGDSASPHLTGQAIDFAKSGMSRDEIAWMRGYLLPIMQAGKIDVEEEFQQSCFHISVYRSYDPGYRPGIKMEQAQLH